MTGDYVYLLEYETEEGETETHAAYLTRAKAEKEEKSLRAIQKKTGVRNPNIWVVAVPFGL